VSGGVSGGNSAANNGPGVAGAGAATIKAPHRAPPIKIALTGMAIVAIVLMSLGVAHVARQQEVIRLGYDLAKATEALTRAREENRRLRLEKSTLTSPERIQRLAESLGMRQAEHEQIRMAAPPRAPNAPDAEAP
jgi:cell division protein FtsL